MMVILCSVPGLAEVRAQLAPPQQHLHLHGLGDDIAVIIVMAIAYLLFHAREAQ